MLMGPLPPILARGREHVPQGCFEGLMPVQVRMIVQELVASNTQVQEALADPLEVVQAMAQAGPYAFHRGTVHTGTVRVMTRILARAMIDRPMVIVGLGAMVDVVRISEALCPAFHLGGNHRFDRRGAHVLEHFERDVCGWCVLVSLVAALHQAQDGRTARLSGGRHWFRLMSCG